jgi:hypothetical protein
MVLLNVNLNFIIHYLPYKMLSNLLRLFRLFRTGAAIYLMASVRNILDRPKYNVTIVREATTFWAKNRYFKCGHLSYGFSPEYSG